MPLLLAGCDRRAPDNGGHLPQRAYLWQRTWGPPVVAAVQAGKGRLDGLVVLGAEVRWAGERPTDIRPAVAWPALRDSGIPISLAIRISPFAGPFAADDRCAHLCRLARELVATAL